MKCRRPYNWMAGRILRISCRGLHSRSACYCTYYHNSKGYPGEENRLEIKSHARPRLSFQKTDEGLYTEKYVNYIT